MSQGQIPDLLIVNYSQFSHLSKVQGFKHKWEFPPAFHERKGKYFAGILGGLSVYWNQGISNNAALLYVRSSAHLKMTPLTVRFDNQDNPRIICVEEYLYAWFDRDDTALKLMISEDE